MKTKKASDLALVVYELTNFHNLITLAKETEENGTPITLQVKGKGQEFVLLPTLKRCHKIIDKIDPNGDIFEPIHDDFDDCVEYLNKNYSIKSKWLKLPESLRKNDFDKISNSLDRMIRTLIGYSEEMEIIPLKSKELGKKLNGITKDVDKKTRDDFNEALKCLNFGFTTASFMLLCRVAEKMAIIYYTKFTQKNSKNKNWNNMYKEIKEKQEEEKNIHRPILALFDFLRTKRNKAQHPGERFDSEESEKLIHYLDDFQKEISKSIDKAFLKK